MNKILQLDDLDKMSMDELKKLWDQWYDNKDWCHRDRNLRSIWVVMKWKMSDEIVQLRKVVM